MRTNLKHLRSMTDSSIVSIELTNNPNPSNELNVIQTSNLSSTTIPSSSLVNTINLSISSLSLYDPLSLSFLIPSLISNGSGKVVIEYPKFESPTGASSVHPSMVLAGLTAQSEKIVRKQNSDGESIEFVSITAVYKPVATTVGKVTLNLNDDQDDNEFIDEDDLLLNPVPGLNMPEERPAGVKDDCDGRKPCDNCTCGRAEREAVTVNGDSATNEEKKEEQEQKQIKDFKSSCGNCAKGDAFRCAGCPFLGKPAFKEGEEHLVLELEDDL